MFDLQAIPAYPSFASIEPILQGGSGDAKYCVTTKDGTKRFLRIGDYEQGRHNHALHQQAEAAGVPVAQTIDFGRLDDTRFYWLQAWVDGATTAEVLPTLDAAAQFQLGAKTGALLHKIHTIPLAETPTSLHERIEHSIALAVEERNQNYGGASPLFTQLLAYLREKMQLLHHRPQTFMHGDYCLSNLLITPNGSIIPTDFHYNARSYGDPCSEFSSFSERGATTQYMAGQIYGYHSGAVPEKFWQAYLFYEAYVALIILSNRESPSWMDFLTHWHQARIATTNSIIPDWYVIP